MANDHGLEENIGKIRISDHILCACVANSTKKFPGVLSTENLTTEKALDIISRDISVFDGVKITRKDGVPFVDVFIVVEYGTQIPKLAWELQKKIKKDFASISDENIEEINIHIEGIDAKEHIHE